MAIMPPRLYVRSLRCRRLRIDSTTTNPESKDSHSGKWKERSSRIARQTSAAYEFSNFTNPELPRLFDTNVWHCGQLIGIDRDIHDHRPWGRQGASDRLAQQFGLRHTESRACARISK